MELEWGVGGESHHTDVARPVVLLGPVVPVSRRGSLQELNCDLALRLEAGERRADGNESGIKPSADPSVQGGRE